MLLPAVTFVHKYYPLPLDLCRRYARMLFFARYRFDTTKRTLACLSYSDFDFVAHVLIASGAPMGHPVCYSPDLLRLGQPGLLGRPLQQLQSQQQQQEEEDPLLNSKSNSSKTNSTNSLTAKQRRAA